MPAQLIRGREGNSGHVWPLTSATKGNPGLFLGRSGTLCRKYHSIRSSLHGNVGLVRTLRTRGANLKAARAEVLQDPARA
jgi:hypothetical protein